MGNSKPKFSAEDEDVRNPLLWLRQREIVHFNRFKELVEYYISNNITK